VDRIFYKGAVFCFRMGENKECSKCSRAVFSYVNGTALCAKHIVSEYYKHSQGCLETVLDNLVQDLHAGKSLSAAEMELLKQVRRQLPNVAEQFPVLMEKI